MTKKEQTVKQAINNIEAAKAKMAGEVAPGFGGSTNANLVLTLLDDVPAHKVQALPRQVQLILAYVKALGGSASVADIDTLSLTAEGGFIWGSNEIALYDQKPSVVLRTYLPAMRGEADWKRKRGTYAVIRAS